MTTAANKKTHMPTQTIKLTRSALQFAEDWSQDRTHTALAGSLGYRAALGLFFSPQGEVAGEE